MGRESKYSILLQHEETGRIVEKRYSYAEVFNGEAKRQIGELTGYSVIARRDYTDLHDKNTHCQDIYEGDIIDENGKVIGNVYENSPLLERGTYLLIEGFGTKTWCATYQQAVERGCTDAE